MNEGVEQLSCLCGKHPEVAAKSEYQSKKHGSIERTPDEEMNATSGHETYDRKGEGGQRCTKGHGQREGELRPKHLCVWMSIECCLVQHMFKAHKRSLKLRGCDWSALCQKCDGGNEDVRLQNHACFVKRVHVAKDKEKLA